MTAMTSPLLTARGAWYQQDISSAGWPNMNASTYYWIALTPAAPLTMTTQGGTQYNGARWVGVDGTTAPLPAATLADPHLFKGRQLISRRAANDTLNQANSQSAVLWLLSQSNWPSVVGANTRFTNWDLAGSNVRYGVQLLGWQMRPTPSLSSSGKSMQI